MSGEYVHVAEAFGLSLHQLWAISRNAIALIFESDDVKSRLYTMWDRLRAEQLPEAETH